MHAGSALVSVLSWLVGAHPDLARILEDAAIQRDVFGISTRTGPGRPLRAIWKALPIVLASSEISLTRKLCFTHERVMPTASHSWNASWPIICKGTWQDRITSGIESMYAVAIPVTAFVTPGPEVTSATPTPSELRAYASAACTAACSWRTRICLTRPWLCKASSVQGHS